MSKNLYVCFSVPQMKYLTSLGIEYELVGLHHKTHNTFWVYLKTEELSTALKKWSTKD